MDKRYFSDKIVKWYQNNKRALPWRDTSDPYKIWLSEIILQQTRVIQGLPYYNNFVSRYPNVAKLAAADEQEVLRLWQGLGYYTRARNLHKCARSVRDLHQGNFPKTFSELLSLPGIGEYTAAAIASMAFNEKVAVVDGNVFRVLARIFGIDNPINSQDGKEIFTRLANDLMPQNNSGTHNQAVMEFGALFCTPKNPQCTLCIFQKNCIAFNRQIQHLLPVKLKGKTARKRYFYYVVVEHKDRLLMKKREEKDIWSGLYDFHLIEKKRPVKFEKLLEEEPLRRMAKNADEIKATKNYKHVLTHQTIFSRFIIVKRSEKNVQPEQKHSFYSLQQISELPKPVLVSRFLNEHYVL